MPTKPKAKRKRDTRPSAEKRGYGYRWGRIRRRILRRDPICVICERKPSVDVDHIKAKAAGGTDDDGNLRGLCHECHSRRTVLEDGGFGRGKREAALGVPLPL